MQFEQIGPDVYAATQPPSGARWFGLPFALAALMPLSGAAGLVRFTTEDGGEAHPVFLLLFALPFLGVGLGMMFFRRRLTVDVGAGTITRRAGLGPLSRTTTRKVADFTAAVFEKRVIRGEKSNRTVWPVMLGRDSGREFDLLFLRDKRAARQAAEAIAKLLRLAVVDRTDGTERRREVDELDLSLRDQRRQQGEPQDPGPPPARMRSTVEVQGDELVVTIPAYGLSGLHLVASVLALGPIGLVALFLSQAGEAAEGVFLVAALAMAAIPVLLFESMVLWHALRGFTVRASARELRVEERGMRNRVTVMPAAEIEELTLPDKGEAGLEGFLGGGPPITASSDHAQVAFGNSLPHRESEYLAAVLRGALSAPES